MCRRSRSIGAGRRGADGNLRQRASGHAETKNGRVEVHGGFDTYSNRVVLTVSDNGCGMSEATLKRAFDPFFSSKTAGRRPRDGAGQGDALDRVQRRLDPPGEPPRPGHPCGDTCCRRGMGLRATARALLPQAAGFGKDRPDGLVCLESEEEVGRSARVTPDSLKTITSESAEPH
jgi:hypothetical protein